MASCLEKKYNIGIRNVIFGEDRKQETCVKVKADVAAATAGKYIVMHAPITQAKHVFWFDDGVIADPVVPNSTLHAVTFSSGATAQAMATALFTAVNLVTDFDATIEADLVTVCIVNAVNGPSYATRDGFAAFATGFEILTCKYGMLQADLGATNGDVKVSQELKFKDITSPQLAGYLVDSIRLGSVVKFAFELKETSKAALTKYFAQYGQTYVTDDAASTVITGYGSDNLFSSITDVTAPLILRSPAKAADADPSEDLALPKAMLKIGEVTMSAENEMVVPCESMALIDTDYKAQSNYFVYGNLAGAKN